MTACLCHYFPIANIVFGVFCFFLDNAQNVVHSDECTLVEMVMENFRVTILKPSSQETTTWSKYYAISHSVMFVVDSADLSRMKETKKTLKKVVSHPLISGKPILMWAMGKKWPGVWELLLTQHTFKPKKKKKRYVLMFQKWQLYVFRIANKQDKKETLNKAEVVEELHLEGLVNKYECPCNIVSSCFLFRNSYQWWWWWWGVSLSQVRITHVSVCPYTRLRTLPFRATSELPTKWWRVARSGSSISLTSTMTSSNTACWMTCPSGTSRETATQKRLTSRANTCEVRSNLWAGKKRIILTLFTFIVRLILVCSIWVSVRVLKSLNIMSTHSYPNQISATILLDFHILMPKTSFMCRLMKVREMFESKGGFVPEEVPDGEELKSSEPLVWISWTQYWS